MFKVKRYLAFFKTGLLSLGGGIGMLPYLEEIAEREGYGHEFMDIVSIAQTFPGPMGLNAAAIIGYRMERFKGAVLAVTFVLVPTMIFVGLLFYVMQSVSHLAWFTNIMSCLKAAMVGVILTMAFNLGKKSWNGFRPFLIGATALAVFLMIKINPVFLLAAGGVLGFLLLHPRTGT